MELLGAAEERRLFAAGNMAALMHWPAGYSVDAADWVTESTAAFSRPFTPVQRQGLFRNSYAIAENAPSQNVPGVSAPLDAVVDTRGLFTQVLFPKRPQRARRASAMSLPPEGFPISRNAAAFVPSPHASPSQRRRQNERFRHGHNRRESEGRFPASRRNYSAGALVEAIRGHQYGQRNPLASHRFGTREVSPDIEETAYGTARRRRSAGIEGTPRRLRRSSGQQSFSAEARKPIRSHSLSRTPMREDEGGLVPGSKSHPDEGRCIPDSSVADSLACQQLLDRQKEMLKQQYEQVGKMRIQIEELQDLLNSLQLQASGYYDPPRQVASPDLPGKNLAMSDLEPQASEEDDNGYLNWSLNPRDYKQMPPDSVDWIPPAGIPSLRCLAPPVPATNNGRYPN